MRMTNDKNNTKSLTEPKIISTSNYKYTMIVDDEPDILTLFSDYLQMKGLKVRTFEDPIQALSELQLNHAYYDVIISDIRMPQMSGIELVKRVSKIDSKIKVIFMSAFELESDKVKQVKNAEFLRKPVKLENLRECIIRILESQQQD
jgi:DNA-binding NtrC family response regulator